MSIWMAWSELPPREAFRSSLKRTEVSTAEYADMQRMWQEKGWRSMRDYLEW